MYQNGRSPVISKKGTKYVLVLYRYDTNEIIINYPRIG